MTNKLNTRVGYFENFKGENSVLISTDINGILEIETLFLELALSQKSIPLTQLESLHNNHRLKVTLTSSDKNWGLQKGEDEYKWILTQDKWSELREKVTSLYKNKKIGHQYLDSNSSSLSDIQVILSLNEYDIEFWEKHFQKA